MFHHISVLETFCKWFQDEATVKTEPWLETKEKGGSRREFSHWQLIHAVLSWTRGLSGFETFPRDENVKVALDWLIGFPGPYYLFTFRNDSFRIIFFPVSKFIVKKLRKNLSLTCNCNFQFEK